MVTRITRMQKEGKKKNRKNPRDFHRFRVPDPNPGTVHTDARRLDIEIQSLRNFSSFYLWKKMAWTWLIAISPDFLWFFRSTPPRFFSSPSFFSCQFYSKLEEEVERGRSPSSSLVRFLERKKRNRTEERGRARVDRVSNRPGRGFIGYPARFKAP